MSYLNQTAIQQHNRAAPTSPEECTARATVVADARVENLREALRSGRTLQDLHLARNDAQAEEVLAREHGIAFRKEHDTLATLMQFRPPFCGPKAHFTVTMSAPDLVAAAEAGLNFKMDMPTTHQLAERMIFTDDKIDLAYGFRILMDAAATYPGYEAVYSRHTVPEDERLDYDAAASSDARSDGCDDPRVIIRELMRVFGDEQIRDLVNERIEAIKSGITTTIVEMNAAPAPPKFVTLAKWWDYAPPAEADLVSG